MLNPRAQAIFNRSRERVSSARIVSSKVAQRYAHALMELAQSQKILDKVEGDLKALASMIEGSKDLAGIIHSPLISQEALSRALLALAEKAQFQTLTKNFLGVLIKNRRLSALMDIVSAFHQASAEQRGEVTVRIQVVQDLTEVQKTELQEALSRAMGYQVTVRATVEPSILGGMVVTVGSRMIDDSVRRKLEKLRVAIGANANQNSLSQMKSSNL
jgi:F-type H+-transporting ATPase subunit delta